MIPNLVYDKEITEKRQIAEINKIPLSQGVVLKNELIVDANIRITQMFFKSLIHYQLQLQKESPDKIWIKLLGGFLGELYSFLSLFHSFSFLSSI